MENYQLLSQKSLFDKLKSSPSGLSRKEANSRIEIYGQNSFKKTSLSALNILTKQFKSSLIYLLAAASILSFVLRDFSDGIVIMAMVLINTSVGFFQEYKSEKTLEKLSKLVSMQILVKRDNQETTIDEKSLVPGDIVILKEGDNVPADIRILESENLLADESQLTGESNPVAKDQRIPKRINRYSSNILYTGSVIQQGGITGIVFATGINTELGKIASLSLSREKTTQYEKSLKSLSAFLMRVTLFTVALIFIGKIVIVGNFTHVSSLFLFVIALAIAVVPEALPIIATITLSHGALRLAKKHVLVKRLSSLEDLGNITLLCTDKTGTLTENTMRIKNIISQDAKRFQEFAIATLENLDVKRKVLNNTYDDAFNTFITNPLKTEAKRFLRLKELPFDPSARRRRVIIKDRNSKRVYLIVIGSAKTLLEISNSDIDKKSIHDQITEDGKEGFRHIAITFKEIKYTKSFDILKNENNLNYLGSAVLTDPLRSTATRTIELAEKLGVTIKILSGDNKEVTGHVGKSTGILKGTDNVISGEELDQKPENEIRQIIFSHNVFAQVTPEQKFKIIQILKEKYVVGYQGDGINDAPSLKLADVGIAVNSATDVAKESAEIILLRKDIEVIINGIQYGRSIFVNINKYIKYTMVGNFGNFFSLAALYLVSIDLPLLPAQLLLTSLITDFPHIFVYSDNVNTSEVAKPQKYDTNSLMFLSLVLGTFTAVFEFIYFATLHLKSTSLTQSKLFIFLTLIQLIVIFSIRNKDYFFRGIRPSWLLSISTVLVFLISLIFLYNPFLSRIFSFVSLSPSTLAALIILTLFYFFTLDLLKVWYFKFLGKEK